LSTVERPFENSVDFVEFDKIDGVEIDFVASVYWSLQLQSIPELLVLGVVH